MAVIRRKKYYGKESVSKKNRPYRFQLDYSHQGKRVGRTIKDVEFLPTDTKDIRTQKERIENQNKVSRRRAISLLGLGAVIIQFPIGCFGGKSKVDILEGESIHFKTIAEISKMIKKK